MDKQFETYSVRVQDTDTSDLNEFYGSIKKEMAISYFSELLDTYNQKRNRNAIKIKQAIMQRYPKPFLFIICLN